MERTWRERSGKRQGEMSKAWGGWAGGFLSFANCSFAVFSLCVLLGGLGNMT